MRAPREDPLVQASARRYPIENLLVQFSILSFVIMTILGIALSVILTTRLGRDFEILKEQAAAAESAGVAVPEGGILKKCVNGQAVYPLSEQDGLKAQERRYTAYGKEKH